MHVRCIRSHNKTGYFSLYVNAFVYFCTFALLLIMILYDEKREIMILMPFKCSQIRNTGVRNKGREEKLWNNDIRCKNNCFEKPKKKQRENSQ